MKRASIERSPSDSENGLSDSESVHSSQELSENGFSDASDGEEASESNKRMKFSENGKKSTAPRAADVRIARETSELFKSNIFKLQIDALLEELAVPEKYLAMANKMLYSIRDAIFSSQPSKDHSTKSIHKVFPNKIPFSGEFDSKLNFKYTPPQDVNVVGSYNLKTTVKQPEGAVIDVVVVLPSESFEPKDFLNYRYFQKRAFYLAAVTNAIVDAQLDVRARYDLFKGDPLLPILRLEFTNPKLAKYYSIAIHCGLEPHVFPARKLACDGNAVRAIEGPTPQYNFAILNDLAYQPLLSYVHQASTQCAEFTSASKLGRLWLRQRGLQFGHFEFALLMAALLNGGPNGKRVLLSGYSSYQLFKGTILYLAQNDIDLSFQLNETTQPAMSGTATLELAELGLNVLQNVPQWSLEALKHEATVACDLLNDVAVDRFHDLFLKNVNKSALKYDLQFTVTLPPVEYEGPYFNFITDRLYKTLSYGCGNRVKQFVFSADQETSWSLSSLPRSSSTEIVLEIGVILDNEHSEKRVTFGPSPNEPGQAEFKNFWRGKSSLRRFQDGKIMEAVVWNQSSKSIVNDIVNFVVSSHFDGSLETNASVDIILPFQKHSHDRSITSLAPWQSKINVFNDLGRHMMQLDIPLRIASVYGISSSLRYTSIIEPAPYDTNCEDNIAEAIIQMESSGRWPDDAEAIEKTKTAMLISIAETLRKDEKYDAIVGVEPSVVAGEIETGFLVVQCEGFSFKMRIATERDASLYSKARTQESLSEEVLLKLKRFGPAAADHHRFISSMAVKFPFYSPTARTLKIWFRKHLLASYVREEVIELLALKPFLDSSPYVPPSSVSCAFYRVLEFLSTWNWKETPLIYEPDRREEYHLVQGCGMDATVYTNMTVAFAAHRAADPAMTRSPYFIGTPVDLSGILWSESLPRSRVGIMIASRTTALARSCMKLVGNINSTSSIEKMFRPALEDFDVEIKLENPSVESRSKFKNLTNLRTLVKTSNNIGLEFYNDISRAFKDSLVLFYSGALNDKSSKHQVITGIWNREAAVPQKFRVNIPFSVKPAPNQKDGTVVLNKDAVIQEIRRLGDNMVSVERF